MDPLRSQLALVRGSPPGDLDAMFHSYSRYVANIALRLIGRDDELDDVVQEVFLAALEGLGALREPGAMKGWLRTVTVRIAARKLRQRRLRQFLGLDAMANYRSLVPQGKQEQAALLSQVYRILDQLPVNERIAWVLRHVEGEALDSVAAACGCSLATAKRRIGVAQDKIEKAVHDA